MKDAKINVFFELQFFGNNEWRLIMLSRFIFNSCSIKWNTRRKIPKIIWANIKFISNTHTKLSHSFDIVFLIEYLYFQDETPPSAPSENYDVNGDELVNIFDITYFIEFLYMDGLEPVCYWLCISLNDYCSLNHGLTVYIYPFLLDKQAVFVNFLL